jgi:hypothetical protein
MRFLTPLLAGAALLTLAAPLAASAEPFHGGGDRGYHQQGGGFDHRDGRGYGDQGRGERGFSRSYGYGFGVPYGYDDTAWDGGYPAYGYADYGYGYRFHHHWDHGHRGFRRGW